MPHSGSLVVCPGAHLQTIFSFAVPQIVELNCDIKKCRKSVLACPTKATAMRRRDGGLYPLPRASEKLATDATPTGYGNVTLRVYFCRCHGAGGDCDNILKIYAALTSKGRPDFRFSRRLTIIWGTFDPSSEPMTTRLRNAGGCIYSAHRQCMQVSFTEGAGAVT